MGVGFSKGVSRSSEQHLLEIDLMFVLDLVDPLPDREVRLFPDEPSSDYIFGLGGGEVHVLEEQTVFAEIAEDVGVAGRVLEEFGVLYHLEIVVVFVDCVQGDFVGCCHLSAWSITHIQIIKL